MKPVVLIVLASAVLAGCASAPEVVPVERDVTVSHGFQPVPRKPDVVAYRVAAEHVLEVPTVGRNFVVIRVVNYQKQKSFVAPTFTPVALPESSRQPAAPAAASVSQWEATIHFPFDVASITAESKKQLDRFLSSVGGAVSTSEVRVEAYTDSVGNDHYNQVLSSKRASAVLDYLVAKGFSRTAIRATGMGERSPVATNDTPAGRALNRRADLHVQTKE